MDFKFYKELYTDVRIEHVYSSSIRYVLSNMEECKETRYSAAFIRVYGGKRWYYSSVSNLSDIQKKICELSDLAVKDGIKDFSGLVEKFSKNVDEKLLFSGNEVSKISLDDKISKIKALLPAFQQNQYIRFYGANYIDNFTLKEFYSSLGAKLKFDSQQCGIAVSYRMTNDSAQVSNLYSKTSDVFGKLEIDMSGLLANICESENFLLNSEPCEPGKYTVVLSPFVTGIFAHECFGHKSESDFMIGDEQTKKEWVLGKKVGCNELSIVDSGEILGSGYVPYDDEGNRAGKTYLIKNGVLAGRLHNSTSALDLNENVTGNARAVSYAFEPIVRMTTTYIEKGNKPLEQLLCGIENGIYIKNITHGSGMSTFTLAPLLAYSIKNGKLDKPVRVSVVSGSVFEALNNVEGVADDFELFSFVLGGCGKMEQFPLPVGFGGPSIRVKNMTVQ